MATRVRKIKGEKKENIVRKIKVRLDNRTVITIKNIALFKIWKEKYPNAEIIA